MKYFWIVFVLFVVPWTARASADLSISVQDIHFSKDPLVAGDEVRIYATVYNVGDEDVSGYVTFFQGSNIIDDSVVISLPANGKPEEVYIDFIVPQGSFNILAVIQGTDPSDINADNNSALTALITPVLDDDRDQIENGQDNCPQTSNSSQMDTDGDGEGDACDSDDDNDNLSDEVEEELSTDPRQSDSDADGVGDASDAYPLDPGETTLEEKSDATLNQDSSVTSNASTLFDEIAKDIAESIQALPETVDTKDANVSIVSQEELLISPNAVFGYTHDAWNTFTFTVLSNISQEAVFVWDFGDGVTSSKPSTQHAYATTGAFPVTLTVTDETGVVSTETTTVFVPFFHLKNKLVFTALGLLSLLLVIAVASFVKLGRANGQEIL